MAFLDEELNKNTEEVETPKTEEIVDENNEQEVVNETPKTELKKKADKKGTSAVKGAFSELKKVSWLTFGKVVKQTVVVLSVTAIFLVVIFGIDSLLKLLNDLLTSKM